ncbi:MFS general substrate transporter [Mucor ambiguus]|uniref:MFS general substrate transporter n=1 Tax=Mucor ambiguus TaxID=91626 RepID=A0A0C9M0H4_9FUNG|nr:MFS general substrate transporter [Mucor ambiguus]
MIDLENPPAKDEATIQQHKDQTTSTTQSVISSTVDHISSISVHGAEEEKDGLEKEKEEPYSIWTTGQLVRFLSICAGTGMISPLTASIYLPALNQIQSDLNTTTEKVNISITVYMIFQAISPTFWGTIADSYGRRPVYLCTMLIYCGACIGLALSPNYAALLIFRMMQAFGSSSVIAIGAGILGDIVDSKRRGSYFGIYSMGQMLGPVLGPVLGGIIAEKLNWKWIFWILTIIGGLSVIFVSLFVPETLRSLVGNGSGYANPTPSQWLARRRGRLDEEKIAQIKIANGPRRPMNFLAPFIYLTEPDVAITLIFSGFLYCSMYTFMTSTTNQFTIHYNLNELQIGLCFLCQGSGSIIGSFVKGKLLDRDFRRLKEKTVRENPDNPDIEISFYKARLGGAYMSLFFVDALPIAYGWAMYYNAPLPVALVLQFLVGVSTSSLTICTQSLIVDLFPGKGASITASNNLIRCLLGAIASVAIEPGIQGVGIGWMFTIVGLLVTVTNIAVPVLIKFGPKWRARRAERYKKSNGNIEFTFFKSKK